MRPGEWREVMVADCLTVVHHESSAEQPAERVAGDSPWLDESLPAECLVDSPQPDSLWSVAGSPTEERSDELVAGGFAEATVWRPVAGFGSIAVRVLRQGRQKHWMAEASVEELVASEPFGSRGRFPSEKQLVEKPLRRCRPEPGATEG